MHSIAQKYTTLPTRNATCGPKLSPLKNALTFSSNQNKKHNLIIDSSYNQVLQILF